MLADHFLRAVPVDEREHWQVVDLEGVLASIVATARHDCDEIEVADLSFMRFLGERAAGVDASWLLELPAEDLLLACAAGAGDATAISIIETRYFPTIESIVRGKLDPTVASEAMQRVREHLFVGERPHILDYAGRGELAKWLTITAVRAGLRIVREAKREIAIDEPNLDAFVDASTDIELAHLRARYRPELKLAFADAFAALEARERNLLRHSVLDGHGVDRIGELYGIHRSTASRWLASARENLVKGTKTALRKRLQISPTEVESILRVLADQIDVTIETILRRET